jgi:hypothetical protein
MLGQLGQTPVVHGLTLLAFALHIAGGSLGLVSGLIAVFAAKGGKLHRAAGNVFFASMTLMAIFALYLALAIPDQLVNVFIAIFAFYLIGTGWLTVRRPERTTGAVEAVALVVALLLCAPFAILSFQLAAHLPTLVKSAVPFEGPVLAAIYIFTGILLTAALSDAIVLMQRGVAGANRIARHLWRMCLGLALAAGSAFTNGLPRLAPPGVHMPFWAMFGPQLGVIALLFFWLARVRLAPRQWAAG